MPKGSSESNTDEKRPVGMGNPCEVLKQELLDFLRYRENISLAEEDIIFLEDIINKRDDYVKWFLDLQKIKDPYMQKLLKLLGEKMLK